MLGIGIDTGGTCTDAVVYDMENNKVLAAAKAMTTHADLKAGIGEAFAKLPKEYLPQCRQICLSTTLATNACVEEKGKNGKLILLGVNEKVFRQVSASYGLTNPEEVLLVDCRILPEQEECTAPDWTAFEEQIRTFLAGCPCAAIVQMYSAEHNGRWEQAAAERIRRYYDIPLVLGHDLFPDRNAIRRGAGALLNTRLIPVIYDFLKAVRKVFADRGMALPMTIIKSDGSQMSEKFASLRPVETLLCGPAASVIGASALAKEDNALIVDMGGTTTDIAVMKNGVPRPSGDGIRIGNWKTFVKGLFIDTFGLGGDTCIHYSINNELYLENDRVIPLSLLAKEHPAVEKELQALAASERIHSYPVYEYYSYVQEPAEPQKFSAEEKHLLQELKKRPLSMEQAAEAMGTDIYNFRPDHLEQEGLVLRAGLTPTDLMHLTGDFTGFCTEAARYAAEFVRRSTGTESIPKLCEIGYELVTHRLYANICRVLLKTETMHREEFEPGEDLMNFVEWNYRHAKDGGSLIRPFSTRAKLVGVGAPTHIFLPKVADLLGTEAVIPPFAGVANAVGAVAGKVIASEEIEVRPVQGSEGEKYELISSADRLILDSLNEAEQYVHGRGVELVKEKARALGAAGEITVTCGTEHRNYTLRYGTVWMGDVYYLRASGNMLLL